MLKRTVQAIAVMSVLASLLCACDVDFPIFEDKSAQYKLVAVNNSDLKKDVYYIKSGTKFYEVYKASTSGSGSMNNAKAAWATDEYENKIPTYYSNEMLAHASQDPELKDITLERYKDTGYSIGIYGAEYLDDGYIAINASNNLVSKTNASKAFSGLKSSDIRIEKINNRYVEPGMINKAGVFLGLEKGKAYELSFWAGTYYGTVKVEADVHFFQSYEMYVMKDHELTKNGYIESKMPEGAKSGYYMVEDKGLFRYIDAKKGEVDPETVDYNEPFYMSEEEQMEAYSQQYNFSLDKEAVNAAIVAVFDPATIPDVENPNLKMMVTSPDGQKTIIRPDLVNNAFIAVYATMNPGKWLVNIVPMSLNITDIGVTDYTPKQEKTQNTYSFTFDEDKTGIAFYCEYEGEGELTGQVISPDGQSHDMSEYTKASRYGNEHIVRYVFPYLSAGEYVVNIYKDPTTKVLKVDYEIDETEKSEEVITIEG